MAYSIIQSVEELPDECSEVLNGLDWLRKRVFDFQMPR